MFRDISPTINKDKIKKKRCRTIAYVECVDGEKRSNYKIKFDIYIRTGYQLNNLKSTMFFFLFFFYT